MLITRFRTIGLRNIGLISTKTGDLMYEVDTKIGWCSCYNGRSGAFCKHQALVHQTHGGDFPNMPTIDAKGRYLLGKLALGDKCPDFEFFIGLKENISQEEINRVKEQFNADSRELGNDDFVELQVSTQQVQEEPEPEIQMEMNEEAGADLLTEMSKEVEHEALRDKINEAAQQLMGELNRIHEQGTQSPSADQYLKSLTRLNQRMKRVKNPGQAVAAIINLSKAANKHTRRCNAIGVQPDAIRRRRVGVSRGCKRIPAGRPAKALADKMKKRRPHSLIRAIKDNVASVASHGKK